MGCPAKMELARWPPPPPWYQQLTRWGPALVCPTKMALAPRAPPPPQCRLLAPSLGSLSNICRRKLRGPRHKVGLDAAFVCIP